MSVGNDGAIAVQTQWRPLLSPGAECGSKALVQCRAEGKRHGVQRYNNHFEFILVEKLLGHQLLASLIVQGLLINRTPETIRNKKEYFILVSFNLEDNIK